MSSKTPCFLKRMSGKFWAQSVRILRAQSGEGLRKDTMGDELGNPRTMRSRRSSGGLALWRVVGTTLLLGTMLFVLFGVNAFSSSALTLPKAQAPSVHV